MKTFLILLTITLTCINCSKDEPQPTIIPNNNIYIGSAFSIKLNQCKVLIDSANNQTYSLCLDSVMDARILKEDCYLTFFPGLATIGITWINQNQDSTNIALKIEGCPSSLNNCPIALSVDTLGYRFCFLKLDPHPDTINFPINQNDYVAKLKITKL